MTHLTLNSLRKAYDGKEVLHGIDAEIENGQFVVIVGPSGCGKSTLLRMIAGLEDITSGMFMIDGELMNDVEPADRGCAMVFQNYALYPHMTVRRNMDYPLKIAGLSKEERRRRVDEAAAILGLEPYLDRRPAHLSGGQRQRVAMGRAIVREPSVFLFDEPLSNLDAKLRVQMRIEIKKLHRRLKATSIFVTHDQVEAMTLADLLIVMNGGRIEQIGTPSVVYHEPASMFVAGFLGSPAMNLLPAEIRDGQLRLTGMPASPLAEVAAGIAEGPVTVGIRPEAILLSGNQSEGLPVTIDLVEELGGSRIAYCALADTALAVVLPTDGRGQEGREVRLLLPAEALHIFETASGVRRDYTLAPVSPATEVRNAAGLRDMVIPV
ncbi:ABC transporter ATP-binding protein [Rhizobium sp. C4]|uniref:ABC transporter ATP-binding protein n=1 Tax=Rhizobium sp. C4 TaxID=1349800 RepID=UPI001E4E846B|nr:sn-glycerol-3-phosphate ABC transporter ATP-binding protein UgpC [Rhizobium sp. C4]MCD2172095.1 sn-glycerol-3-phosphate ABC transporter ATP-binding protein UgpC [Rhizobium sp. C4]